MDVTYTFGQVNLRSAQLIVTCPNIGRVYFTCLFRILSGDYLFARLEWNLLLGGRLQSRVLPLIS